MHSTSSDVIRFSYEESSSDTEFGYTWVRFTNALILIRALGCTHRAVHVYSGLKMVSIIDTDTKFSLTSQAYIICIDVTKAMASRTPAYLPFCDSTCPAGSRYTDGLSMSPSHSCFQIKDQFPTPILSSKKSCTLGSQILTHTIANIQLLSSILSAARPQSEFGADRNLDHTGPIDPLRSSQIQSSLCYSALEA